MKVGNSTQIILLLVVISLFGSTSFVLATDTSQTTNYTPEKSHQHFKPNAPTNLHATPDGTKVKLDWSVPTKTQQHCENVCTHTVHNHHRVTSHCSLQCTPITVVDDSVVDYKIEYSSDNGDTWIKFNDGKSANTTATVTNLERGVSYIFRVSSISSAVGDPTPPTTPIKIIGPPDPPTITRNQPGHNFVHIWWSKPYNGGSPITDYILQYKLESDTHWTTQDDGHGISTNAGATSLEHVTKYQFRVIAVNAEGNSKPSNIISVTTANWGAPSEPINVKATPGNKKVKLEWDLPIQSSPNVRDYIIEYREEGGTWKISNDGKTVKRDTTVLFLTGGVTYEFRISAENFLGTGEPSAIVTARPTPYAPDAPTNLTATPGDKQVTLSWDAPIHKGGSPITHYKIEYRPASTWATLAYTTNTDTFVTIINLTSNTTYFFKVSAVNAIGIGESSKTISAHIE